MSDDETPAEVDPVQVIQNALSDMDPDSLCVGFATVVEWLEKDGSRSLSVLHTDMPPWQLYGLMTYGRDHHCLELHPTAEFAEYLDEDDDED